MMHPLDAAAAVGRGTIGAVRGAGAVARCSARPACLHLLRPPFYSPHVPGSAFIEFSYLQPAGRFAMTAIFSGMVIALQILHRVRTVQCRKCDRPGVVVLSVVRELGPVLAGLMVAGRVGAAMAAEIGTMRVTDQIDALRPRCRPTRSST